MSNLSSSVQTPIHIWRFMRAGGFDQVCLDSGADLMALDQLDLKLWVALSCPTRGLEFDITTLDLIDIDHDGRIRVPEIIAAVKWALSLLNNQDELLKSSPSLHLDAINDSTPEGKQLLASARQILTNLGKADASMISVEDTMDTAKIFAQTNFNGDGIIPADATENEVVKAVINDIIACLGAETDRSGKPGINQAKVDLFFAEAQAYSEWWAKAESDATNILPIGDATANAAETLNSVKAKVDDYFARCRLAAFDSRALNALNRQETEYLEIAAKDLTITTPEVSGFPISRIEAGRSLPLRESLNPAWDDAIAKFQINVIRPLLGNIFTLTEAEWYAIKDKFAGFDAWNVNKAGTTVETLGLKRISEILAGESKDAITRLIEKDKALESEVNAIASVDKLIRYNRDLYKLLNNFVSFRDFYGRKDKAIFQAGTLYLDQRSCDLCIYVDDMGKHGSLSHLSRIFLAYCDLTRRGTGEKMTIAAAFTDGDSDNLMVGRNGIFYDRKGHDWDATIVKIIDNPISIRQAFWSPYKRTIRWIGEQIAKRATAADAAAMDKLTTAAMTAGNKAVTGSSPAAKPKIDIGMVAALGVAVGGITAALGMLLQAFFGLGIWMPLGVAVLLLLISGPSVIIAWLKLRQRNLGPILDANGWAINTRALINIPFGSSLTATASPPPGSRRDLIDPYAESKAGRYKLVALILLLAVLWGLWNFGVFEKAIPDVLPKSEWVKKHQAEAKAKAAVDNIVPATTAPAK
jgi:hypothetical protein